MYTFWRHGDCRIKQKLQVYNAKFRSKLMYGLDTISITMRVKNALNAFHVKGLRRILKLFATFLPEQRHYTNEYVLERNWDLSEYHKLARIKRLAKLIRHSSENSNGSRNIAKTRHRIAKNRQTEGNLTPRSIQGYMGSSDKKH